MERIRGITVGPEQQRVLEDWRDHPAKPYLRERAAAILKMAAGVPIAELARSGLLRPRDTDTLYQWRQRFVASGPDGLRLRPGRGRKPPFSP